MLKHSPWLQIAIGYAFLEVAFWTEGRTQAVASVVAAGVIIALTFMSLRPASQLGLKFPNLTQSLWPAVIGVVAAGAMVEISLVSGSLHELYGHHSLQEHVVMYFIWAVVQQFILQSFFYVRVESRLGNTWRAVVVTAALFSLAHIPNPVLVPATFIAGIFFCAFFRKYRTIYPLAIAHAVLGLAVAVAIPDSILHHMRVGIAYLHYP